MPDGDPDTPTDTRTAAPDSLAAGADRMPASTRHSAARLARWRAEEPALVKAWQERASSEALTTLLARYDRLFRAEVARMIAGNSLHISHRDDLLQEAQMAFIEALARFDLDRGTALASFATPRIRNNLLRYALDNRNDWRIGTGSAERKAFYAAMRLRRKRQHEGTITPLSDCDIPYLAEQTGVSASAAKRAIRAIQAHSVNLDCVPDIKCEAREIETLDSDFSASAAMTALAPFLRGMDDRKRAVFHQIVGASPDTSRDLATRFGVSVNRIGQIRRRMLADMAEHLESHGIAAEDVL